MICAIYNDQKIARTFEELDEYLPIILDAFCDEFDQYEFLNFELLTFLNCYLSDLNIDYNKVDSLRKHRNQLTSLLCSCISQTEDRLLDVQLESIEKLIRIKNNPITVAFLLKDLCGFLELWLTRKIPKRFKRIISIFVDLIEREEVVEHVLLGRKFLLESIFQEIKMGSELKFCCVEFLRYFVNSKFKFKVQAFLLENSDVLDPLILNASRKDPPAFLDNLYEILRAYVLIGEEMAHVTGRPNFLIEKIRREDSLWMTFQNLADHPDPSVSQKFLELYREFEADLRQNEFQDENEYW